ncbi:hypothetical protein [Enemella sp. A6]|uniref:hypothetical protein n=1 Tax=Enemella sp. A6 TaxID=3440152 RepID=UPI003EBB5778
MEPANPLDLINQLQAARNKLEAQLAEVTALQGSLVRTGRYVEVERGADGELARITVLAAASGSAISNEVRELWLELSADAAERAQQGLAAVGITQPLNLPGDVRAILEERR